MSEKSTDTNADLLKALIELECQARMALFFVPSVLLEHAIEQAVVAIKNAGGELRRMPKK